MKWKPKCKRSGVPNPAWTRALLLALFVSPLMLCADRPNVAEIIQKSVAAMKTNWEAAPKYAFVERDVQSRKDGPKTTKTWEVYLIGGSNYNKLIAVDDKPLSKEQQGQEEQKMREEIERRRHESPSQKNHRIQKYRKEREQDGAMMTEMAEAFAFTFKGEGKMNGRDVWILDADPKPGYVPKTRDTRVLLGMKGRMWIDKETSQWVRVEADVIRPVSFYGFFAKVHPGTKFMFEMAPVAGNIWLPKRLNVNVNATALGFLNEDSTDDETYSDYKPNPEHLSP